MSCRVDCVESCGLKWCGVGWVVWCGLRGVVSCGLECCTQARWSLCNHASLSVPFSASLLVSSPIVLLSAALRCSPLLLLHPSTLLAPSPRSWKPFRLKLALLPSVAPPSSRLLSPSLKATTRPPPLPPPSGPSCTSSWRFSGGSWRHTITPRRRTPQPSSSRGAGLDRGRSIGSDTRRTQSRRSGPRWTTPLSGSRYSCALCLRA